MVADGSWSTHSCVGMAARLSALSAPSLARRMGESGASGRIFCGSLLGEGGGAMIALSADEPWAD